MNQHVSAMRILKSIGETLGPTRFMSNWIHSVALIVLLIGTSFPVHAQFACGISPQPGLSYVTSTPTSGTVPAGGSATIGAFLIYNGGTPPANTTFNWLGSGTAGATFGVGGPSNTSTSPAPISLTAGVFKFESFVTFNVPATATAGQTITVNATASVCTAGLPLVYTFTVVAAAPTATIVKTQGDGVIGFRGGSTTIEVQLDTGFGPPTAETVNFSASQGFVSPANVPVNGTTGLASTTFFFPFGYSGPIQITASSPSTTPVYRDPGNGNAFVTFNLTAGAVDQVFRITQGDGQQGAPGEVLPIPLEIMAFERLGTSTEAPVDCVQVNFTVLEGDAAFLDGTSTVSSYSTLTGSNPSSCLARQANRPNTIIPTGLASVPVVLGSTPGPVVIQASPPSGTVIGAFGATPVQFNLTVLPNRALNIVSGNGQVGTIGFAGAPLVVELSDTAIGPISGETITWSVSGGGVELDATTSTTDANGRAQVGVRFTGATTGTVVTATDSSGLSANFTFGQAGNASIVLISGSGQSGAPGSAADSLVVFEVRDATGRPLPGVSVRLQVSSNASIPATTISSGNDGRVSTRLQYGQTPGLVQLTASINNGASTATANATIFSPNILIIQGNNQTGVAGTKLPVRLGVRISQPAANAAKGLGGTVIQWQVVEGGGTLLSATSTTDTNGEAFNEYTLGSNASANRISASVGTLGSVTFTQTATVNLAAATIEIVSGNNQSLPTNLDSEPLVIRVKDSQGRNIPGVSITWRGTPAGTVSVTPEVTTTGSDGTARTIARVGLPGQRGAEARFTDRPDTKVNFSLNGGVQNLTDLTPNQTEVAEAIDEACPALVARGNSLNALERDLLQRCSELVVGAGTDPDQVEKALDEMLADESEAQSQAALDAAELQFDNLKARTAALRSGSNGADFNGMTLNSSGGALPLGIISTFLLGAEDGKKDEIGTDFSRWGFFATGTIGRGERDPTDNAVGFDYGSYGLTAGVDYRFTDSFILGAALGLNRNDTDIADNGGGIESSGLSFSGYATWYKDSSFYLDAVLTLGRNDFDLDRTIQYNIRNVAGTGTTTVNQIASASADGSQTSFAVSFGRDFNKGALSFGPYIRAMYTRFDFDGYEEQMSNPNAPGAGLGMRVEDRELTSRAIVLGGKLSYTISRDWGILMPNVNFEWQKEMEDGANSFGTSFINDPTGTPIVITGDEVDTSYMNIGLGLSALFAGGKSGFIYWEHILGLDHMSQDSIALGFRMEF